MIEMEKLKNTYQLKKNAIMQFYAAGQDYLYPSYRLHKQF